MRISRVFCRMAPVSSKLASRSGMVAGSGVANPRAAGSRAAGSGLPTPGSAPHGRTHAMEVLWTAEEGERARARERACVDCGLNTGNFCDGGMSCAYDKCFAAERVPADYKMNGKQRTPLCSYCETLHEFCRFCRGVHSCTPPIVQSHWSGVPQSKSREFNALVAAKARARQLLARTSATNERSTSETLLQHLDHVLPRVANPENAVVPVTDWYGPHLLEGAVDFATDDEAPIFIGGGTTGEVAVCDTTPHRFLAGRYRELEMP